MLDTGCSIRDLNRLATAATMKGVPAKRISRFGPVSLPGVWCNRNYSKPSARSHSRDGNCGANAHLSPTEDQNIFPNKDALPPMADHKNKFRPSVLRLWRSRAPSACRTSIRRPRLTRDQGSDLRSPRLARPRVPFLPAPLPDNASQNLDAARPSVIPNGVVCRPVALCEEGRHLFLHLRESTDVSTSLDMTIS
jgi:hypothetical protein